MLDDGQAQSQTELAKILGVSKSRVTQILNLLELDEEVREFILGLEDTDERLKVLTERRLRSLARLDREIQKEKFLELVALRS